MSYDDRDDTLLQIFGDYVLLNEILATSQTQKCLQKTGIKFGLRMEDQFRSAHQGTKELSMNQYTDLVAIFFNRLNGKVEVTAHVDTKVIFSCLRCPFNQAALKTPALCEIVVGMLGGLAARNFPYSKVSLQRSITQNSISCRMVVYLQKTEEAENAPGDYFSNEPGAYLLKRDEIRSMSENAVSTSRVYQEYLQSLEQLETIHRDMETEYNQLKNEIFSDLKLGVLTVNVQGKFTYMNRTAQEFLSIADNWEMAVTKKFKDLLTDTMQNNIRHNQHILQILFSEQTQYYSVNTAPLTDQKENVTGAVCVFQDVTEKKLLEAEILQMEKFSLLAELAAGTAHEIRNPLTTMRGFLQLLSNEFKVDSKGKEYCALMIEELDRANHIIKEFLLLTKPAAPKLRKCNIHDILEDIFLLIESKSLLENVALQKEFAQSLPPIEVDASQIKQVFLNLATNAIQAMPKGGKLTISTSVSNGVVLIRFADSGCGMAESKVAKIFDPFFTTKEQGTGLGLTISYRIIETHQGRLYAESSLGKGTTFYVELPAEI